MKSLYLRTAIFISVFALIVAPIQAHAKDAEKSETSKLRQLRSELPAKIKEQAAQVRERVENLESTMKKSPETTAEPSKPITVDQGISQKEPSPQKNTASELAKQTCIANEARINTLIGSLNTERQEAIEKVTRISEAAQTFYAARQLRVSHYDQLVSAVAQAETIAETTKSQLVANSAFSCNDDALRATMQTYQEKRAASAAGVKVYRDATKSLVNAVRDASKTSAFEASSK